MRPMWLRSMLAVAVCGSLLPSVASAQLTGDSVVGAGVVAGDEFEVSVQAGPSGENPTGFIRASGVTTFEGVPTCLRVSGDRASAAYRITSSPDLPTGSGFVGIVQDNGPLGAGPPDVLLRFSYPIVPPVACPDPDVLEDPGSPFADIPFERGDVTVTDAPAVPTSKSQCSNGGWRTLGFENQGQCVSFVATAGNKQP